MNTLFVNFNEAYQTYLGTLLVILVLFWFVLAIALFVQRTFKKREEKDLERKRLFEQLKMEK